MQKPGESVSGKVAEASKGKMSVCKGSETEKHVVWTGDRIAGVERELGV